MDMTEASAMTETSGLIDEQDGIEQTSRARRRPLQSPSQEAAMRRADRLREVTVRAPLRSLFVAFLAGVWFARRLAGKSPEPTRQQESNLQAAILAALRKRKGGSVIGEGFPQRWRLMQGEN